MTGFTEIEQPAQPMNGAGGIEQAATDLLDLMGGNEEITDEPEVAEEVETDEVEAQSAAEVDDQEQPEGDSEQDEVFDLDWSAKTRIKANGEETTVTLQELRDGFLRQSDYTRKQQELAQERQRLEAQFGEINNQREQYGSLLDQQRQQLEALIPQEPDWGALAAQSPETYQRQRAAWDQLQGQLNKVKDEQKRVNEERQQTFQSQMAQYLQREQQALLSAKAELADPEKRQAFFTDVATYAQNNYGFSPQELQMVNDHRLWLIAEKARKYDELQSGGQAKKGGVKSIPTLKAGQSPNTTPSSRKLREARSRFNKSGDTRDAARLIEQML